MNTTGSVTLLHKLVTLQNLYSSFLSNNAQALKEGKPLPEQLSINLFKLIYLINSNSLINKQFDVLSISSSFQAINGNSQTNGAPYIPALSITDIIKIIIEVLGKDSIIIPQQSSSNKDKQLLRLSSQISLEFIKQNLGEIFIAYKKETLLQIETFENEYAKTIKELELIENNKVDDKTLLEEYARNLKAKEAAAALPASIPAQVPSSSPPPQSKTAPSAAAQSQTPVARKQGPVLSTPQTAPPATRRQQSLSTPADKISSPSADKVPVPSTQVKNTSQLTAMHRATRSADRKIEVTETPLAKQKEVMKNEAMLRSEEEAEKQKIAEEIEDSLIGSDRETELAPKQVVSPAVEEEEKTSGDLLSAELAQDSKAVKLSPSLEKKEEVSEKAESEDSEGEDEREEQEEQQEDAADDDEVKNAAEVSTPKEEANLEVSAPTPEPVTPPTPRLRSRPVVKQETHPEVPKKKEHDVSEGDESQEEDEDEEEEEEELEKPKTRSSARKAAQAHEESLAQPVSSRKRKKSETPSAEPPSKQAHHSNKKFQTIALQLITQISTHRFASTFLQPVSVHDEPEYYSLVKQPQDLKTITKEIKNGTISDFPHLERNLILMFCNALMYNGSDSDISVLTLEMMNECEEAIKIFKDYL